VPADESSPVGLNRTRTLVQEDASVSPDMLRLLAAVEQKLGEYEHLQGLDESSRMLASVALVGATGVVNASDAQALTRSLAVTKALATGDIVPEDSEDPDAALRAAGAMRALLAAGGSGPRIAATIVGLQSDSIRQEFTNYCTAADALDPDRKLSFAQIYQKALTTAAHVGFNPTQSLEEWQSSAQLGERQVSPSSIRDGIPSIALLALARPPNERSPAERAAISAVRNRLMDDLPGSNLSFANGRIAKFLIHADRAKAGMRSRLLHKNPLAIAVKLGETQRTPNAISSMRASMRSAKTMAELFGGLHRVGTEPGGASTSGSASAPPTAAPQFSVDPDALYHAVMFKHWGNRFTTTQQLDTKLEEEEKSELIEELERTMGTEGPEIVRLREKVNNQTLDPVYLEKTGWDLVGYLGSAIDAVAAEQVPAALLPTSVSSAASASSQPASPRDASSEPAPVAAQRNEAGIELARRVVSMLAETCPTPTADAGAPPASVEPLARARTALAELEAILLPLRTNSGDMPIHEERARALADRSPDLTRFDTTQARRDDPIGYLARAVIDFELGDSLAATGGKFGGVGIPLGAVTAFMPGSPVHALGGPGVRRGTKAVVSASLTSAGGEVFLGTARNWTGEVGLGVAVGIGGTHVLGAGGGAEVAREETETQGVYLRIPRNGEADGGAATPGLNGDHVVARRMSELLESIQDLSRSDQGDRLLLALMERFPELSVSVVRGRNAQTERRPFIFRARIGAGVVVPTLPSIRVFGASLQAEQERGTVIRRDEEGGRTPVRVLGGVPNANRLGGAASVAGLAPATNANLLNTRMPMIAANGFTDTTHLVRQDGAHSTFSFRLQTTPNLLGFKSASEEALPGLVDFAQTRDLRRKQLTAKRIEDRPSDTTQADAKQRLRDEQAARIMNGIENIKPALPGNQTYTVFSVLRPDRAAYLDQLHAMINLMRDNPAFASAVALLEREYEDIATHAASFQPAYAFQSAKSFHESSKGLHLMFSGGVRGSSARTSIINLA
jgi:hypothetical protein